MTGPGVCCPRPGCSGVKMRNLLQFSRCYHQQATQPPLGAQASDADTYIYKIDFNIYPLVVATAVFICANVGMVGPKFLQTLRL